MAYTRIYPIATRSYDGSDNPSYIQNGVTVTDSSGNLTGVRADLVTLISTASEWFVTLTKGVNIQLSRSYRVSATPTSTSITLLNMDGSEFTAPTGSTGSTYQLNLFKNTSPSQWDGQPEAILLTGLPTTALEIITSAGQYVSLPKAAFVVGAIYSIGVRKIVNADSATGFLLGSTGINGSAIIG